MTPLAFHTFYFWTGIPLCSIFRIY